MAVLADAIYVIIRVDSIEAKFPCGWDAFTGWVQNSTLCVDREVARVGFMSPDDTTSFIDELEERGLQYLESGHAIDIVLTDQRRGFAASCNWAEFAAFRGTAMILVWFRRSGSSVRKFLT
jgi:hypothetical protein